MLLISDNSNTGISHNKSIGCGASGAYALGPDDEKDEKHWHHWFSSFSGHRFLPPFFCRHIPVCRDEVTGEWRKLHNEELNDLYSLLNTVRVVKSRRMRWAGHVARMGDDRAVHRVLVGKPEGKRPLGRPRRRWENNIKMDLQKVGRGRGDWIELAQDRDRWRALVGTVRDFRVP